MRTKHSRWGVAGVATLAATMVAAGGLMPAGHAAPPDRAGPGDPVADWAADRPSGRAAGPIDCPEPLPIGEVEVGASGTGYTVATGRTVETFEAEVLGLLEDGIGPDRDLIVVDLAGAAIEGAGGVWSGMSGSPVYVGDRLLGAVSYSMSGSSSTLAGLTPAEDMLGLLDLPAAGAEAADGKRADGTGIGVKRVEFSPAVRAKVAARHGESAADGGLERMRLPVSISGLRRERVDYITEAVERAGLGLAVSPGGRAPAPGDDVPATGELAGGDNYVAALSYGDVTSAAIGTTTLTCGESALAFGHPFLFGGAVRQGASAGDAISVVPDAVFGPYKLANIAEPVGIVDQDRMAGLRTVLGEVPSTIPVRSTTTVPETNASRGGATEVVASADVPSLTPMHLLNNIDVVLDQLGAGGSKVNWTVHGVTASGAKFELKRANRYTSDYDIAFDSIFELEQQLYAIAENPFTDVEFTGVDLDAELTTDVERYELGRVEASVNGGPFATGEVVATPGDTIRIRAVLSAGAEPNREVTTAVTVPDNAKGAGVLAIGNLSEGGVEGDGEGAPAADGPCLFPGMKCASAAANGGDLEEYLADLAKGPRNDELRAELSFEQPGVPVQSGVERTDRMLVGTKYVDVALLPPH